MPRSSWRTKASSSRPRLADSLSARFQTGPLGKNPATAAYFFPNGKALAVGDRRTNPDYAATLRAVAKDGRPPSTPAPIAQNIVDAVHAGDIQGDLSLKDLADYKRAAEAGASAVPSATTRSAPPRPRPPAAWR